jgi:hypothetical protein
MTVKHETAERHGVLTDRAGFCFGESETKPVILKAQMFTHLSWKDQASPEPQSPSPARNIPSGHHAMAHHDSRQPILSATNMTLFNHETVESKRTNIRGRV